MLLQCNMLHVTCAGTCSPHAQCPCFSVASAHNQTWHVSLQGDSGFAVFRKGALLFQSKPLQHFFDCPYQFASCPDFTEDTDRPEDASEYELQLTSGDVIVAATDGLWDNLHTAELLPLLPDSEDTVKQVSVSHPAQLHLDSSNASCMQEVYSAGNTDTYRRAWYSTLTCSTLQNQVSGVQFLLSVARVV